MNSFYPKLRNILFLAFLMFSLVSLGQVGIGTIAPDGVLDLNSDAEKDLSGTNNYGLVLPRVALTRTDVAAPVVNPDNVADPIPIGTVVYNTNTSSNGEFSVYPGIYMWDGVDWINEFPKKNAQIFEQDNSSGALRTITTGSYQNIPGLTNSVFTPTYTGTYKIEISVNWGSGQIALVSGQTGVTVQKGIFKFAFDSDPDELIPAYSWAARHGSGTQYYDIWEQTTTVMYKELVAGTNYTFSLSFDQTSSPGIIDNGNTLAGRGWLGGDIPCTVEFVYLD